MYKFSALLSITSFITFPSFPVPVELRILLSIFRSLSTNIRTCLGNNVQKLVSKYQIPKNQENEILYPYIVTTKYRLPSTLKKGFGYLKALAGPE